MCGNILDLELKFQPTSLVPRLPWRPQPHTFYTALITLATGTELVGMSAH